MTGKLHFDFLADKEQNTLTIRREFAAGRQLVWDCYTKSELLDQWFAPKPLTTKTKSMDFSEGGHWHYAMIDPEGKEYWGRMDYLKINPINHYSAMDAFSDAGGAVNANLPRSTWNVQFKDHSVHTMVETVVSYTSLADLETILQMGMQDGLAMTLDKLDELLAELNG